MLFGSCSVDSAGKSGVDETTNALATVVLDSAGKPLINTLALLRPLNYIADPGAWPSDSGYNTLNLFTDARGQLLFSLPDTTINYALEVRGNKLGLFYVIDDFLSDTLLASPYASLSGAVKLPSSNSYARIVVLGLDRSDYTDSEGQFTLKNLPPGDFEIIAVTPYSSTVIAKTQVTLVPSENKDSVLLTPVEVTIDEFKSSMKIILNTSATGVLLEKSLYQYPLLVYLENDDFPIGAAPRGDDIRVYDSHGNELSFGIAWWDASQAKAQLWIQTDSIVAGDSAVIAEIRWGSRIALSKASMKTVFDKRKNWLGAWDLLDLYQDESGLWRTSDFSSLSNAGVVHPQNGIRPNFSMQGTTFNESEQFIAIKNPGLDLGNDSYTLEMWLIPPDTCGVFFSGGSKMFSMTNQLHPTLTTWENDITPSSVVEALSLQVINSLIHVAFVSEAVNGSSNVKWYIQGKEDKISTSSIVNISSKPDSLYIAAPMHETHGFLGLVSRVRLSSTARSADWIRFSASIHRQTNPGIKVIHP